MQSTQIGGTLNINVYEMLQSWVEGTGDGTAGSANWNQSAPATNWTTAGGTYNPVAVATLTPTRPGSTPGRSPRWCRPGSPAAKSTTV